MARVRYRPYDPAQFNGEIEFLSDVDEYYQDVLHRVGELQAPKIFITAWLLHPIVRLNRTTTFCGFLVEQLMKAGSEVRILWNTNYNGMPYPDLLDKSSSLHRGVIKAAKVPSERFQIILSTNLQFDLPNLPWQTDFLLSLDQERGFFGGPAAPDLQENLQELWIKRFPASPDAYKNLAVATLGSHHQKTLIALGTLGGQKKLIGYCGGIDFSSGPSGRNSKRGKSGQDYSTYNGGRWWHDAVFRIQGNPAIPLLDNFVERWNLDLEEVEEGRTLAFGLPDEAELDDNLADGIQAGSLDEEKIEVPRTIPLGGGDWPSGLLHETGSLEAYEDWISEAESHIILINQYVRHPGVAELLLDQLNDESSLRLTIIMPSYAEEVAKRMALIRTREKYAVPDALASQKAKLLAKAAKLSLTIDPLNKLTLFLRSRALGPFLPNPRCRVWIPRPLSPSMKRIWGYPYIHAKMMLIDRKAVMVGSANVNGRSLDGLADSEINVLVTDTVQIDRLFSKQKWHEEPENQQSPDYPGSWYKKHNLIRYTEDHRRIDEEYGRFPRGRAAILDYFDKSLQHGRLEKLGLDFDRARVEQLLNVGMPGFDIDGDIGEQLAQMIPHLI